MRLSPALACASLVTAAVATAQDAPKPPYWASIRAGKALMRTGPGRNYPASWLYQRADLPMRVTMVLKEWRKVQDPDGTEGWMLGALISSNRTAIVRSPEPIVMRDRPASGARVRWRAAPGVVGRISQCGDGWCRFEVKGQDGYVETTGLWGVEPGERVP